jgi:SecD/SecF fusion protein
MNKQLSWKFIIIGLVTLASCYFMWPPLNRDIVAEFEQRAMAKDAAFNKLMEQVRAKEAAAPLRSFQNLREAAEEQKIDLRNYFPGVAKPDSKTANLDILNQIDRECGGKIKLGLDLKGGTSFLLRMDMSQIDAAGRGAAVEQAIGIIGRRVNQFGVSEPIIQRIGNDRILVQLPGLAERDRQSARKQIERTAYLEFRIVHANNEELQAQAATDTRFLPPIGYTNMVHVTTRDGQTVTEHLFVKLRAERNLTGKYVERAYVAADDIGRPNIALNFNKEGAVIFAQVAAANPGRRLAIILDGEVQSAPRIEERLSEDARGTGSIRNAQITGQFSLVEARHLASVLENPLQAPVKVLEERSVDPSLGRDAVRSGLYASGIAAAGVLVFMVAYYMIAGFVATLAMALNMVILVGVLALFKFTLTLPGIAGIALTIGMSVDANVLIFERIREELAAGKPLRAAFAAGYQRAWLVIFDSNLTTILSGAILIWLGTGALRGFGVTLVIGLIANLFSAVFATRVLFDWMIAKGLFTSFKSLSFFPKTNINFLGSRHVVSGLIALLLLAGGWMFVRQGGLQFGRGAVYGVDFTGGDGVMLKFAQRVDAIEIRKTLEATGAKDSFIQYQREGTGLEVLSLRLGVGEADKVVPALQKAYPAAKFTVLSKDEVGAVVGKELGEQGMDAIVASLLMIMIYVGFRFGEFAYGIGSLVALLVSVLASLALFVLSGRTFSMPVVAAILTIVGYGINDTIVVFDRIRENRKLTGGRIDYFALLNRSVNDTLSRTMLTGGSTIFATVVLLVMGGRVLNDFAFTFLVGVIVSTVASVCVASPIVLWFHRKEAKAAAAKA